MITKVAGGILGIGLLGTGSIAVTKPHWLGMDYMPTNYTTLSGKKSELNNKWVKDYRIYFVNSEGNDAWFDWVFRNRYEKKDSNKTAFANITQGGGKDVANSLAKACKEAYDAESGNTKIKTTESDAAGSGVFFEDNIWKYCSVGGKKLKTVNEETNTNVYSGKAGDSKKTDLLSAEYADNDWAWHIKQKEFLNGASPSTNSVFKKFHTENKDYKEEKNGTRLKEGCKKWYKEGVNSAEGENNLTADDLKKYCSLKVDESNA